MAKRRIYKTSTVTRAKAAVSKFRSARKKASEKTLTVRCPTCGAAPGEKCELSSGGQPRANPHRDRRLIAKD